MQMLRRAKPIVAQPVTPARRINTVRRSSVAEILNKSATRHSSPVTLDSAAERSRIAEKARNSIDAQLKLISKAEAEIDQAQADMEKARRIIEAQLRLANLVSHSNGVYDAELVDTWTKQSRSIDAKKFRNKVSNDVFWGSIDVSISRAKEHLSEKELNEISDIVPSVKTGTILKVSLRRKKK